MMRKTSSVKMYLNFGGHPTFSAVEWEPIRWVHLLILVCQLMSIVTRKLLLQIVGCPSFHFQQIILAQILTVGSFSPKNLKTELYDYQTEKWFPLREYPYSA